MKRIAVIGDVMLDTYHHVTALREAPEGGPLYSIQESRYRPGAAANLADCLETLGWSVHLIAPFSHNHAGRLLDAWAQACHIHTHWQRLPPSETIRENTRYHDDARCLLRIDQPNPKEVHWTEMPWDLLATMDAVVLYDKGSLREIAENLLHFCKKKMIRTYVDPSRYPTSYAHTYLMKANELEFQSLGIHDVPSFKAAQHWTHLVITHGAGPVIHWDEDNQSDSHSPQPTSLKGDSIGAGDAFLAGLISAEHKGCDWKSILATASRAGQASLAHIGTYAPTWAELESPTNVDEF